MPQRVRLRSFAVCSQSQCEPKFAVYTRHVHLGNVSTSWRSELMRMICGMSRVGCSRYVGAHGRWEWAMIFTRCYCHHLSPYVWYRKFYIWRQFWLKISIFTGEWCMEERGVMPMGWSHGAGKRRRWAGVHPESSRWEMCGGGKAGPPGSSSQNWVQVTWSAILARKHRIPSDLRS